MRTAPLNFMPVKLGNLVFEVLHYLKKDLHISHIFMF
jgi:hypothetical protein